MNKKVVASGLLSIFFLATALLCSCGYDLFAQQTELESTEGFYTVFTGNMPGAALKPEKQVSVEDIKTAQDSKDQLTKFFAWYQADQLFPDNTVIPCCCATANTSNRSHLSTVIFPFHYFW